MQKKNSLSNWHTEAFQTYVFISQYSILPYYLNQIYIYKGSDEDVPR